MTRRAPVGSGRPREITDAEIAEIRKRTAAGETPTMIGKAIGRSPARIYDLLGALGLPVPPKRPRGRPRKVADGEPRVRRPRGRPRLHGDEELAELRAKLEAGASYAQLGRELGRSRQWVFRLLNPVNKTGRPQRYWCRIGRHHFESSARNRPERCTHCRSMDWWRDDES